MTIQEALVFGRRELQDSPSSSLDARLLLQRVLQVNQTYLVAHGEEELTAVQTHRYHHFLQRAGQGEPIPYLVGHAPFYGRDFTVTPAVLIPRPETEQLVDTAVAWANSHPIHNLIDVGTGSGCIAITLSLRLPDVQVYAVDISAEALAIARQNARQQNTLDRIRFFQGNLLAAAPGKFDLIVANLPYVTNGEWTSLDVGVKSYEPALALKGGADGLDLIRQLLAQAITRLHSGGAVFLEIGWRQGTAVRRLAEHYFPGVQVDVLPDFAGHDRIVLIQT
jgi:release factor glutamine methyltransferase